MILHKITKNRIGRSCGAGVKEEKKSRKKKNEREKAIPTIN